jgi:hypothetical protein
MTYFIYAEAPDYEPEKEYWPLDIFGPTSEKVVLRQKVKPSVDTNKGLIKTKGPLFGDMWENLPSPSDPKPPVKEKSRPIGLVVRSEDALAPLEVTDNSGNLIAAGSGELVLNTLKPGIYRARLITPENNVSEQIVSLKRGKSQVIELSAPRPAETKLLREIIAKSQFEYDSGNNIENINYLGPHGQMATAQVTTIMTLIGGLVQAQFIKGENPVNGRSGVFPGLRSLENKEGIRILFADDLSPDDKAGNFLSKTKITLSRQSTNKKVRVSGLETLSDFKRLGHTTLPMDPGNYFVKLHLPDRIPAIFSMAVLRERMTLLVIHQDLNGNFNLFGFAPLLDLREKENQKVPNLRRLELLQRFYSNNRIDDHAYRDAKELLYAKWMDPFAGCLGGYTMIDLGKAEELRTAAYNMRNYFGELSDSHVIMAEHLVSIEASNKEIVAAYKKAMSVGLPLFAPGLEKLVRAIEKYDIRHPQRAFIRKAFEDRIRGVLWTAWTPPKQEAVSAKA